MLLATRFIPTWDCSKLSSISSLFLFFALISGSVQAVAAVDISDPTKLMFVGDRSENLIDVISLDDEEVIFRIKTSLHPDHIVVTPFAPILVYTNIGTKTVVFYDLKKQQETRTLELPISPRHVVLDTTGAKIGISDDVDGGFVLIHAYARSVQFALEDFPPTTDVLFDPNDVDIYYSNEATGSMGLLDTNTQRTYEMSLTDEPGQLLSAPSRSIDGRYIYVANVTTGEVYSLNAYSKIIFNTFEVGAKPARPYTTPEGTFLYMMDEDSGRLLTVEQQGFTEYADSKFDRGVNLVAVGRFDRMNLFLSSANKRWYVYDNVARAVIENGDFLARPLGVLGAADGKTAYVAFADAAQVAIVDLEKQTLEYIPATENGSGAFTIGLSNNVCH